MMYGAPPLTYDEWKRIKAATRWRHHQERMAMLDEASAAEWELAMRRDTATDPYEEHAHAREVPA